MTLHLIKLTVGADSLEHFAQWQDNHIIEFEGQKANAVLTRFTPKHHQEILKTKGSIYRVIKGMIRCRQQIIGFGTHEDAVKGKRCVIYTDTDIVTTLPQQHRPFQGWRYFQPAKAPQDNGLYQEKSDSIFTEMGL